MDEHHWILSSGIIALSRQNLKRKPALRQKTPHVKEMHRSFVDMCVDIVRSLIPKLILLWHVCIELRTSFWIRQVPWRQSSNAHLAKSCQDIAFIGSFRILRKDLALSLTHKWITAGSGRLSLRVSWCIWAGVWPGGVLPQLIQKRNEVAGHIGWAKQSLGGPREEQTKVTCSNMENHFFVTDPPGGLGPPQGLTTTGGIVWGIRWYSFGPHPPLLLYL